MELLDADIETMIQVVRDGIIEFITNAEPHELVAVAAFVANIEDPDPDEVGREMMQALRQEAVRRR